MYVGEPWTNPKTVPDTTQIFPNSYTTEKSVNWCNHFGSLAQLCWIQTPTLSGY